MKSIRKITLLLCTLILMQDLSAQVTGTRTIPGDYASLEAALNDLNTNGVGAGGAVIVLNQPEQAPLGGYRLGSPVLNNSLSAADTLVINGNGNTLTAFTGSGNTDAIFMILGADYVTIDALHLLESSSNTTPVTRMEWGYALLKHNTALAPSYDGCHYVIIRNCNIQLGYVNGSNNTIGIYGANHSVGTTTALPATGIGADDANSHNRFSGNTISGCQFGIQMKGFNNSSFYDLDNRIGEDAGNHITVGGVSAALVNSVVTAVGITDARGVQVHNCTLRTTGVQRSAVYGVRLERGAGDVVIRNNDMEFQTQITSTGSVFGINNESFAGNDARFIIEGNRFHDWNNLQARSSYVINSPSAKQYDSVVVRNNVFERIRSNAGVLDLIHVFTGTMTRHFVVDSNVFRDIVKTGADGLLRGIYLSGTSTLCKVMVTDNVFETLQNNSASNSSTPSPSVPALIGIYVSSQGGLGVSRNRLQNLSVMNYNSLRLIWANLPIRSVTTTSSIDSNSIEHIQADTGVITLIETQAQNVFGNTFRNVTSIQGRILLFTAHTRNEYSPLYIYDNLFSGIALHGGSFFNRLFDLNWVRVGGSRIYNNTIDYTVGSDYQSPVSASHELHVVFYANQSVRTNILHNTVRVSAAAVTNPSANRGIVGIWSPSGSQLHSNNNIINIDFAPSGAGITALYYRHANTMPNASSFTANGNVYYVPNLPNSFIYSGSGGTQQFGPHNDPAINKSCGLYKTAIAVDDTTRERRSFYENNLVAGAIPGTFVPSGASYAKEAGVVLTPAIPLDYAGVPRPSAAGSDAGALQFTGDPSDILPPVISYNALPAQSCDTASPVLDVTIADNTGVNTSAGFMPRLYYRKVSDANSFGSYPTDNNASFNGWKYVEGVSAGGQLFLFEPEYSRLQNPVAAGDEILYFVIAQDQAGNVAVSEAAFPAGFCLGSVNLSLADPVAATPAVNRYTIQDDPVQALAPPGTAFLCGGAGVDLEVPVPGQSGIWFRNDTLIPGTFQDIYTATDTGAYFAFVRTATCFYKTLVTELEEIQRPVIVAAGAVSFCAGDSLLLYTDSSVSGRTYLWLLDGAPVPDAGYASVYAKSDGAYAVVAVSPGCRDTSHAVAVQVLQSPSSQITTSTADTFFCHGDTLELRAESGHTLYEWFHDGAVVSPLSGDVLSVVSPGGYRVRITGSNGCVDSSAVYQITSDTALAAISVAGSTTLCSNDSVILNAPVRAGYIYGWSRDGVMLPDTDSSFIARQSGVYKLYVTTTSGCADSSAASSVLLDTVNTALILSGPDTFCSGDSVIISAAPVIGYNYEWKMDGVTIPYGGADLAVRQTGSYRVVITSSGNCVDSSVLIQVVSDTVDASLAHTASLSFCAGDGVALEATPAGSGYSYTWLQNGAAIPGSGHVVTALSSGTYQAVVVSARGCTDTTAGLQVFSDTVDALLTYNSPLVFCAGDSVRLSAQPSSAGYSYIWIRDGVMLSHTDSYLVARAGGQYRVVAESMLGCVDTSAVLQVVSDTVNASITHNTPLTFCAGESVSIAAQPSVPGYTYSWIRDGNPFVHAGSELVVSQTGLFRVVVSSANNCTDTSVAVATNSDTAVAVATALGPLIFCDGDSVLLEGAVFPGYSYQWFDQAGPVQGASGSGYTAREPGDYFMVVTTAVGCHDTSSVLEVVVNVMPDASISIDGDTVFCSGNSALLRTQSGPGYVWEWFRNGMLISGPASDELEVIYSGSYSVIVTAGAGCSDTSDGQTITVLQSPVPGIIARDPNMKTGWQYVAYQWYLNGMAIPGANDSLYRAAELGAYTVEVEDSFGCVGLSYVYNLTTLDIVSVGELYRDPGEVKIYPNPASTYLEVEAPFPVRIRLMGMDGKILLDRSAETRVNIDHLPDAIYMLHISGEDGLPLKTERILKEGR